MSDTRAIGVIGVESGTVQMVTDKGITQCFALKITGHDGREFTFAVLPTDVPQLVKTLVESARHSMPDVMSDVKPL